MFDGKALSEAHEMRLGLLKGIAGSRYALEGTKMSTAHGDTASDGVPFSNQLLDGKVQVWKGGAQHPDHQARRLGTTIRHARRNLVIDAVGGDQVVYDGEIALVEHLLIEATKLCLIC